MVMAVVLCACTSSSNRAGDTGGPSRIEVKVMTFNVEYGGEEVDFDSVIETIEKSDADIVGIEEAWGNVPRIARRLGWQHYDPRTQIISRYPLLAPPKSDGLYALVEVRPGGVVAIGNVHLPSGPYGPFQIEKGAEPAEILALERRVRVPAVRPFVNALSGLAEDEVPAFLVGDFNSPSALDWTSETVGLREHIQFPLEWPVSEAMATAGFEDSYRVAHPDPAADPGITWPAARPFVPGYNPARNGAAADRIDFVYAAGPATTVDSTLVGERGESEVDISVAPWPTDHRAVLSTFEVEPADAPTLVSVDRRVIEMGDDVRIRYHSSAEKGERVVVVRAGREPEAGAVAETPASRSHGSVAFSTMDWGPGTYEAVLVAGSGAELSRIPFWVERPGTKPRIAPAARVYEVGEPIEIRWEGAPGNRWDWVGIYRRGADPNVASYLLWLYTDATIEGSAVLDDDASGRWPLKAGGYSVYLLEDDSYKTLAAGTFTIR
jgi:endonuclease/exonuclease/phosphatase family metal-dependent hydrolase